MRSSRRRTRTMTAFREHGQVVVVVPAGMTERQRRELVPGLVQQFLAKESGRRAPRDDAELTSRAVELYRAYVAPHADGPEPVFGARWVADMRARWGSCTTTSGEIRLSDRLRPMPNWVVDYVLVHELTHLVERAHNARFWQIVGGYDRAERARGFLEGVDFTRRDAPR
ncbi:MAG: M48 family metallopeptidase [Nigerium sp.]|nr:M48 family metallopeptidase [Nigerium sp.]